MKTTHRRSLFSAALSLAILTAFPLVCTQISAADLYVSAPFSGAIYKILPNGTQTTFAQISQPRGLAFDSSGNLFVANSSTGLVSRITPAGVQSIFASGLSNPVSIVFDTSGNLFVADIGANTIYKFTPAGGQSTFASNLNRPAGLAFDSAGNLYESEGNGAAILKFTPSGIQSTFASGLNFPAGLVFDKQGFLYEADQGSNSVLKFAPDGTRTTFAVFDNSVDLQPIRFAVDSADNIYVSETTQAGTGTIYKFTPAGVRSTFASETEVVSFLAFLPPVLKVLSISRPPSGHIVLQCLGAPNQVNDLQVSANLSAGSFATISPPPPAADGTGAFTYDDAGAVGLTKRFYRLAFP